ncbi:hypothetical protein ACJX0J_040735, partial [Zea mays]
SQNCFANISLPHFFFLNTSIRIFVLFDSAPEHTPICLFYVADLHVAYPNLPVNRRLYCCNAAVDNLHWVSCFEINEPIRFTLPALIFQPILRAYALGDGWQQRWKRGGDILFILLFTIIYVDQCNITLSNGHYFLLLMLVHLILLFQ